MSKGTVDSSPEAPRTFSEWFEPLADKLPRRITRQHVQDMCELAWAFGSHEGAMDTMKALRDGQKGYVNVPQQHTLFFNVIKPLNKTVYVFSHDSFMTRSEADAAAPQHRIACIEVTFAEGEGLERAS